MITAEEARNKTYKDFEASDIGFLEDRIMSEIRRDKKSKGTSVFPSDVFNIDILLKNARSFGYRTFKTVTLPLIFYVIWNTEDIKLGKLTEITGE
jgi:hypothetical protein